MLSFRNRLGRRGLVVAACTVLTAGLACKQAWPDAVADGNPHVQMRPFSEIARLSPPAALPPLHLTGLDGAPKSLADFRGKPVVLNFWATWCAPCVAELPELDRLAATDSGVTVLVVSTDRGGAGAVRPFIATHGITHATVLLDAGSSAARALNVSGYPTTLLIDAAGNLRGRMEGPASWASAAPVIASVVANKG